MLYAAQIIDLLGAFPLRRWRVMHICNRIAPGETDPRKLRSMQRSIQRALIALSETGAIVIHESELSGQPFEYQWKARHELAEVD